ncbi:MAG: hypothetical protein ACFE95_00010 [Candidatus Hodarchaeota archaeon]
MDYKSQMKEKAHIIIDLSHKLLENSPQTDHSTINQLKNLGELILNTCTSETKDNYDGVYIERLISMYQQKYGFYSSEVKQILEETESLALDWYKNVIGEREYNLNRLKGQIHDQIDKLQDKDLFEENDSEFLVPLGKILSHRIRRFNLNIESRRIYSSSDYFKIILRDYAKIESIFEAFQGSEEEQMLFAHWLSDDGLKAIQVTKDLILDYLLEGLSKYSDKEVLEKNEEISLGIVASFYDNRKGGVPIVGIPEVLIRDEKMGPWLNGLANSSFAALGFVSDFEKEKFTIFDFEIPIVQTKGGERCKVFGYVFAFDHPETVGGQENLSLCLILRPSSWNPEIYERYLDAILEGMRLVRDLMKGKAPIKFVQKAMENLRNFYTYSIISENENQA